MLERCSADASSKLKSLNLEYHFLSWEAIIDAIINEINKLEAARCCQRDTWTALKKAVELSKNYLPVYLKADGSTRCTQQSKNKECMGKGCPYI